MDWSDLRRTDVLAVTMVSPTNLDAPLGELVGLDPTGCSVTAGYYTDTRTSGRLAFVGDGWVRGSILRLWHRIPEWGYEREVGTYMAVDDPATRDRGSWRTELELHSMLKALSTDVAKPKTLGVGASALAASQQILETSSRPYVVSKANDTKLKDALVLESGTDQLSRLYSLAKACDNRLDVDAHGRVTIDPYQAPYAKSPVLEISLSDPRGVAQEGITRTSNLLSMPNRAYVSYRYTDSSGGKSEQREIVEFADATGSRSPASVGWVISDVHSLSEMEPQTAARAQELARQYLEDDQHEHVEWELTTAFLPVWEGDVVDLVVDDGPEWYRGRRRCLVKSLDMELAHFTMRLTLKEVRPHDDEKEE